VIATIVGVLCGASPMASAAEAATPYVLEVTWTINGGWTENQNMPQAVAVGPTGTVYVLESVGGVVTIYDQSGNGYFLFGKSPHPNQYIQQAFDLEVENDGDVLVADVNGIERFQKNGTWLGSFGPSAPAGPIAIAPDGSVYAYTVDGPAGARIERYSTAGALLGSIGSPGTGEGEVTGTRDIDVLASGDVVVVDGSRVQVIGADGAFIRSWTVASPTTGLAGVDVDESGRIHVTLGPARRVAVFTTSGTLLTSYGVGDLEIPAATETAVHDVAIAPSGVSFAILADPAARTARMMRFRVAGVPRIDTLAPNKGPTFGGGVVHLTGSGFTGVTAVRFGSVPASFTLIDNRHLDVVAPGRLDVALVNVFVETPRGTTVAAPRSWFQYQTVPAPTVSSLSPRQSKVAGGDTIHVYGTNFTGATSVRFGPFEATTFTVLADWRLTAVVPPSTGPLLVNVFVTTPAGTSEADGWSAYFSYKSGPTVTGLSPSSGVLAGGTSVTITGTGFLRYDYWVRFGGVSASASYVDTNHIVATAPPGAEPGSVDVVVSNQFGDSATSPASSYTYVANAIE